MKIGIVSKGLGGVEYHRLIKPFSLLNGEHDVTRCEGISSEAFDYGFDVVVFNRMLTNPQTERVYIATSQAWRVRYMRH
jgi:hypothetical protein